MPPALSELSQAIENNDAQQLLELFEAFVIPPPDEAKKNLGLPKRFTFSVSTIQAWLRTRHWPSQAWGGPGCAAWREDNKVAHPRHATKEMYDTAQVMTNLVLRCDASLMDVPQISHHPVWRYYRSTTSANSLPWIICHQFHCLDWISRILDVHEQWYQDNAPDKISMLWKGMLQWPSAQAKEGLEHLRQRGLLDQANPEHLNTILNITAQKAQLTLLEWVIQATSCQRLPGVQAALLSHRRLDGATAARPVIEGWERLNELWGDPDKEELTRIWTSLLKNQVFRTKGMSEDVKVILDQVEERLTQLVGWGAEHRMELLRICSTYLSTDFLEQYVSKGWQFSDEELAQASQWAIVPVGFGLPPMSSARQSYLAYIQRMRLTNIAQDGGHHEAPAREKRPAM